MATLRDIANELEISVPVVSRVLNGKSDVRASQETKQRIFEVAEQLNYRPTASARALATGRSMQIAVLSDAHGHYSNATDHYPDLRGLVEAAERHDYRVLVLPLHKGKAGEQQLENLIVDKFCDGLCVASYQLEMPHLKVLQRCGAPFVIMGGSANSDLESKAAAGTVRVDVDNQHFVRDSVQWLQEQGHARIALAISDKDGKDLLPHLRLLREGYLGIMETLHLQPNLLPALDAPGIASFAKSGAASAVIVRDLPGAMQWISALDKAEIHIPQDLTLLAMMEYQDYAVLRKIVNTSNLAFHLFQQHTIGVMAGEILVKWANGEAPNKTRVFVPTGPLGWDADVRTALEKL